VTPGDREQEVARASTAWGRLLRERLEPLGITEEKVFAIVGKGVLEDGRRYACTTSDMKRFWELSLDLGVKVSGRIPPLDFFRDDGWPWRIDHTPAFGNRIVQLYDLLAKRIAPRHRAWAWDKGPVPTAYNEGAAELTADILNALGCSARTVKAGDVKSRLQKRGRASLRD